MAHDVWLTRTLITCLLMSFNAGATKDAKGIFLRRDTNISAVNTLVSTVQHHLVNNDSYTGHKVKQRTENTRNETNAGHKHVLSSGPGVGGLQRIQRVKRSLEQGSEQISTYVSRMKVLDTFFAHPEKLVMNYEKSGDDRKELDAGRESLISALLHGRVIARRYNKATFSKHQQSKLEESQVGKLNQGHSGFRDWSRKGFGKQEGKQDVGGDGLHLESANNANYVSKNMAEGSKIVKVASLLGHSLESQGTGSTLIKRLANRPSAYHYFLPAHPMNTGTKLSTLSRYRLVNSFIKPQLAGIFNDLEDLETPHSHTKLMNLEKLKAFFIGNHSNTGIKSNIGSVMAKKKVKLRTKQDILENQQAKRKSNYEKPLIEGLLMLDTGDNSSHFQNVFMANTENKTLARKGLMAEPTSRLHKKYTTPGVNHGINRKYKESHKLLPNVIKTNVLTPHSSDDSDMTGMSGLFLDSTSIFGTKTSTPVTRRITVPTRSTVSTLKSISYEKEKSHWPPVEEGEGSTVGQQRILDNITTPKVRSYLISTPTKRRSFPRLTTKNSLKRTTVPQAKLDFRYESSASGSEEVSIEGATGSGEAEMGKEVASNTGAMLMDRAKPGKEETSSNKAGRRPVPLKDAILSSKAVDSIGEASGSGEVSYDGATSGSGALSTKEAISSSRAVTSIGEISGSGEDILPQHERPTETPTHKKTTKMPLSSARGIFRNTSDKETNRKCEKMGKADHREKCPLGWLPHGQFCYLFVEHSEGKWEEFPQKCNEENALLAMPKSEKEMTFLKKYLSSVQSTSTKYFYVGLKKKSGSWTWIDDVLYTRGFPSHDKSDSKSCAGLFQGEIHKFSCRNPKAGYICELKTGVEALRILAFGDSLTNGFHGNGKHHTPYAKRLEYLLNKDVHRCYVLTTTAKDGAEASEMSLQLQRNLQKAKPKYSWVIILAGTNDISHNSHTRSRRAWDAAVEHIINLHIDSHRYGAKTVAVTIPEMDCEESTRPPCRHTHLERKYINEKLRHYARSNEFTVLCDLAVKLPRYSLSNAKRKHFWEVGLHMKPEGYDRMAEIIYKDLLSHV